jgi:DNA-binding SARP family transcriptional activator/WD40 repeat protein/energy-coupling factor transporter ATP-binding protein EcfA2
VASTPSTVGDSTVVEVSILGPIAVIVDGVGVDISGPKERAVLAVLAASTGDTVSTERIADAVWAEDPPRSSGKVVQNLVLRLRKELGNALIETRPGGYALRVSPGAIDAPRFEQLVGEGRDRVAGNDPAEALASFRRALDLWRGAPLAELVDWPPAEPHRVRLEELHRCAWEEAAEAGLALGDHRGWVTTLETMVADEPLRERRWELLMVALSRSGRQVEALRAYQRARTALADLGLEPGRELRAVEQKVSGHDPSLAAPPAAGPAPSLPTGVVAFLLTDIEGSASLWEQAPDRMIGALEQHDAVIQRAVTDAGGVLLKSRGEGDSTFSVFSKASAAVAAALAAHAALTELSQGGLELPVRLAVHVGEAHERDGDYYGPTVNRAARIRGVASGGQILLSESVAALVRGELPDGWDLAELGDRTLRGLSRPERVFTLVPSGGMAVSGATVVARSCPYMGLLAYQPEDEHLFFGRASLVAAVVDRVGRDGFVAVVGPSGSGKSSLVRAGAIAALTRSTTDGSEPWITVLMTPGARPLAELAAQLAHHVGADASGLLRDLETNPRSLDLAIRHLLASAPRGTRFALVVDQFEELFTLCKDESERSRFLDTLVDAATADDRTTHVIVAMRADFYGHCATHSGLADLLGTRTLLVGAMDDDGIRAAIEGPAILAGLSVQPGLVDLITRDVTGEPGALPLLSHALLEMWSRRDGRTLTIAGYRAGGGVAAAIARTADNVYDGFTPEQQAIVRRVFLRLTELGEGTEDTRRRVGRDELGARDEIETGALNTVLDRLASSRLITVSDSGIDVAHEALIRQWPRLRQWLDDDRDGLRVLRRVTNTAREWDAGGRDDGDLYRGARLTSVLEWRASSGHGDDLNVLEDEFLNASLALHDAELREADERARARERSYRSQRRLLIGTSIALVIALAAGGLAIGQRNRANKARDRAASAARAEGINSVATLARTLPASQSDLALLLGLEANRLDPSLANEGALESAIVHAPIGLDGVIHLSGTTFFPTVSPDGRTAAVPLDSGAAIVDLATGATTTVLQGAPPSQVARLSPDGGQVVIGGAGTQVQVWDAATGRPAGAPIKVDGGYGWGVFDPADPSVLWIVSPSGAGASVARWDRSRPESPAPVGEPFEFPFAGSFPWFAVSADGTLLATGGTDMGSTIVWDVARHAQLHTLPGATGGFVPGTHLLATAGLDRVTIWNASTGEPDGKPLSGFLALAGGADAISSDGRYLAAVDVDNGIRVFDLQKRAQLGPPLVHSSNDVEVGFLPDGRLVTAGDNSLLMWRPGATVPAIGTVVGNFQGDPGQDPVVGVYVPGSDDVITQRALEPRELQRWNAHTGSQVGDVVGGDVRGFATVNPDGTLVAGPLADGAAIAVWDLHSGTRLAVLPPGGVPTAAVWVPHSNLLATTQSDQQVDLWDLADPGQPKLVRTLTVPVGAAPATGFSPDVSPDGRLLAVADTAGSRVSVFEVATGRVLWSSGVATPDQVGFSPDGRTLAVLHTQTGTPQQVDFDDATTGKTSRRLEVPGSSAIGLAYVQGGSVLATTTELAGAGTNGGAEAQLWDVATLEPIGEPLQADVVGNFYVYANNDGSGMVTGTTNGHAVAWDLNIAHWADTACRLAGRNLTQSEWARYLPTEPYHTTCPQWPAGG